MTYKRLNTVSAVDGSSIVEYTIPEKDYGKFRVDTSHFQPRSEAIKQLTNGKNAGGMLPDIYYDFPDGRDTGQRIPVDRLHGVSDITEISTAIRQQQEQLSKDLKKAQRQKKRDAEVDAIINAGTTQATPATQSSPTSSGE